MSKLTAGDTVTIALYGYADQATVKAVSDNGRTIYVNAGDAYYPQIEVYTLRANGEYVIKGKQATTINAKKIRA
jgi:hypothetical protein